MILFKALRGIANRYDSGGLVEQMIKHPKKLYFKFSEGKFNIRHGAKEYVLDIEDKEIGSTSFTKFIADVIGCSNFGVIKRDDVSITKVDNYFLFVYNFKSNDEAFEIIYDSNSIEECTYYVSVVGKFMIFEDASESKSVDDIKDVTGISSVSEVEVYNPAPVHVEVEHTPEPPVQTIHERAATGGVAVEKDPYDTALNDNKYTGPVMPI
jgi:hypothetical protein